MFSAIYYEQEVRDIPLVQKTLQRFTQIVQVPIERYGEVFNRKSQNFRLQKRKPALILARKHDHRVLPAPPGYGFGEGESYYFSHMLNCVYDCRYCFLQGMYRSANYVLFVNFEDFAEDISMKIQHKKTENIYFYSGYDCDSLALEPFSRFTKYFVPLFKRHENAWLELRTKSTQIRHLLEMDTVANCVIAYSFSPEAVSEALEYKVPALQKRIDAIKKLQNQGWPVALRFEPLIYHQDYKQNYLQLFNRLFSQLDVNKLHSVSMGLFRMPNDYFANIVKLYPDEKLFASGFKKGQRLTGYESDIEAEMVNYCQQQLLQRIPDHIYYRCVES
ncbi:MAG: DNA photolyase [Gammaproteobacteria bacterium]|jgi:spore photoproduct lyase|nr:DNA photolyase [Gammaproteobacteria bacterium]